MVDPIAFPLLPDVGVPASHPGEVAVQMSFFAVAVKTDNIATKTAKFGSNM